ncbi:phosphoribosylaminoimidazole-succinocarboxamide synthase [Nitzschia inconspicua]|uniref:phosphoribosylaminoimidazolesuccinocarboxamide synthase n=1 Tax=Nitzschia inconspicua TaxID=303405 RepID=A0A9K3PQK8_9STRA|nr:phosphoribosylaminoimidazole-succinocarboxamide synthase [Nitzschia inconspicua]
MSSGCKVFLAVSTEEAAVSADLVATELAAKFDILDVTIRSSDAPVDRLLCNLPSSANHHPSAVWIFYPCPAGSFPPAYSVFQDESPYPVLKAQATDDPKEIAWTVAKWCSLGHESIAKRVHQATVERRQAKLVEDAQLQTKSFKYLQAMSIVYDRNLQITGERIGLDSIKGKVRDRIHVNDKIIALVTTDRQSGFDRQLALVPFKGAVLNLTSAFWFEQTKHIIPNHIVAVPHPYVTIAKKCQPFPIEFVVRAYMTGSTDTSIWKNYQNGVRNYCGHALPEGMVKNQKLPTGNLLTPTTKEEEHDRPISAKEIVDEKWMTQEDWDVCAKAALEVFALGQEIAAKHGLILVDTKYEFGRDLETGEILLIDEVHTPDSSRYWLASSYEERIAAGMEPENIDKEFLRLWFREQCDPYKDKVLPEAPRDLVLELSRRYITLYEMITWNHFDFSIKDGEGGIASAIKSFQ